MNKIYAVLFICLLCVTHAIAQKKTFHIAGKVSGDTWINISPLANTFIQIKEAPKAVFLTDSSGYFKIDNLNRGKYRLKFSYTGFQDHDTTIIIKNVPADSLNIILPLYYYKKGVSTRHARKEIRKGHPHLYACTENDQDSAFYAFYKKYKVWSSIFNKSSVENNEQFLPCSPDMLAHYNREAFRYLEKTFGKEWHNDLPRGVIGFENWKDEQFSK